MAGRRLATLATAFVACLSLSASASRPASGGEASGLEHAFRSREALAKGVLAAIERGDEEALRRYLVTEEEHRTLLWDQLPESGYLDFRYARRLNERSTGKAIRRVLERYGGQPLRFVGLTFEKETEAYDGFALFRGAALRVRHASTGAEGVIPVLDVLLERNGWWKPMNYDE